MKDGSGDFKVSVSFPGELNIESLEERTLCFTNGGECGFCRCKREHRLRMKKRMNLWNKMRTVEI